MSEYKIAAEWLRYAQNVKCAKMLMLHLPK